MTWKTRQQTATNEMQMEKKTTVLRWTSSNRNLVRIRFTDTISPAAPARARHDTCHSTIYLQETSYTITSPKQTWYTRANHETRKLILVRSVESIKKMESPKDSNIRDITLKFKKVCYVMCWVIVKLIIKHLATSHVAAISLNGRHLRTVVFRRLIRGAIARYLKFPE